MGVINPLTDCEDGRNMASFKTHDGRRVTRTIQIVAGANINHREIVPSLAAGERWVTTATGGYIIPAPLR